MKKSLYLLLTTLLISVSSYGQTFLSLPIKATKVLFDAKRNKLLAIVNSLDVNLGNKLIQINTNSGAVENSVVLGSDPTCMALTYDSNYVYVGLDGASQVKRVNLNSFLVDKTIPLGNGSFGPMFAEDVATIKGSPDIVVVSRKFVSVSPRHAGVAAYKNTIKLNNETPTHTGSNILETIYGTDNVVGFNTESTENGFRKMLIDTVTGVQLISTTTNMPLSQQMEFESGYVYSNNGKVVDPNLSVPSVVGTFNLSFSSITCVDANPITNKVFFASIDNSSLQLKSYSLQSYTFLQDTLVSGLFPNTFQLPEVQDLECYGSDGIAVIVSENYFNYKDKRLILFKPKIAVGVKEIVLNDDELSVFPNPTNRYLNINFKTSNVSEVLILDNLGRIVFKDDYLEKNNDLKIIDLKTIPDGVHFIYVRSSTSSNYIVKKLVKFNN